MRLYCHCLNISIDVLKIIDDQETVTEFVPVDLVQIVNTSHEWLVGDVVADRCVHTVWSSLVQTIPVREMQLNRCLNCRLYTHMTTSSANRILFNRDLFNEINVHNVYRDPNYSDNIKIILPLNNSAATTRCLSGSQDEHSQHDCELAQQIYRQALEDTERETDEKIRTYQQQQEQLLEAKTGKLKRELNLFLNVIRSVPRHPSAAKTSPTSSAYINENSTESGFGSDIFDIGPTESGRCTSTIDRGFFERTTNSDEETNDDPMLDTRATFHRTDWCVDNSNLSNLATSLPKTIAIRPLSSVHGDLHRADSTDELERIGKSFRDLSRSMCTDGTELFGELPSPRLNSRPT